MSKLETENVASPVTYFCLYRLVESSSSLPSGTQSPHSSLSSTGFNSSTFSSNVDSSDGNDLEVIASDLQDDLEKQLKLKKHILSKITKNMSYESGSILLLPTLVLKNKVLPPTKCYWSALKGKDAKKYILCLISASESEGFNLFRYDLEKFAKRVETEILAQPTFDSGSPTSRQTLSTFIATWYSVAVDFVPRTALLLGDELEVVVHSCLMGHKIEVKSMMPAHASLVEDTVKLIEAIQLPHSGAGVSASAGSQGANEDVARDIVILTFDASGRPQVDANETNEFCREWAARLVQAGTNRTDAIMLRGWIEVVKMQLTQELNHIRKLSDAAVVDNYALYEAFLYLKHNPNKDVLLVLLMKEGAADAHSKEVLHTIFKCLTTNFLSDSDSEDAIEERSGSTSDLLV